MKKIPFALVSTPNQNEYLISVLKPPTYTSSIYFSLRYENASMASFANDKEIPAYVVFFLVALMSPETMLAL